MISGKPQQHNENSAAEQRYEKLKESDRAHHVHGFSNPAITKSMIIFEDGDGAELTDVLGTKYLDALGGLTTTLIGHGRKELAQVAFDQMTRLEFIGNQKNNSNPRVIELIEKLLTLSNKEIPDRNYQSAFFCADGASAVDEAIHLAWRYWDKKGPLGTSTLGYWKKKKIISFKNCYHGTTFLPASLKPELSEHGWHRLMEGLDESVVNHPAHKIFQSIDFPNEFFFNKDKINEYENVGQAAARLLEETIINADPDQVAAFVFEPVQGEGGAVVPHPDFFPLARKICDKHGVLMIADEIMTFTKTGKWFASATFSASPDLIVISKALTSGYLPLSSVIFSKAVADTAFGSLTTKLNPAEVWQGDKTYSGHPTCCAVASRNLEIVERENAIERSGEKGRLFLRILKEKLGNLHVVRDVRGCGLMLGLDFASNIADEVEVKVTQEYKILLRASSNHHCILMTPSVVMTEEQFTKVADALHAVLTSWATLAENAISRAPSS
ncbi:hypothetical protein RI367_001367 [Sorochytrium milnesiophthora]